MKNECDIVKDLLFSYNDGVLSEASKNFVEKHLKTSIKRLMSIKLHKINQVKKFL